MARRKQEIALQSEIETQEEWEDMLAKEGLTVVDVYQEWAGPCKAMVSNFRRLKNELGDDMLRFSVAKADTVDCLEKYRMTCKPCFLFHAGGVLVAVVRGCNSPLLLKTITEQLAYEHKVLEGNAERKEIRDPLLAGMEKAAAEEEEEEEEVARKDVTMAIIKPDVVAAGKVDEVIETLKESGIEIIENLERTLTEEEARSFYEHRKDEEFFEGLITFMTSGPSHFLILTKGDTGEGIIEEWRDLLGPASVEEAKEQAPESFRAKYGTENYVNALHGSDSKESAARELALFFPGFKPPTVPGSEPAKSKKGSQVQRTLALIRPDAMAEKKDEILAKIEEAGFTVAMAKEIQLTKEQAQDFYKEHEGQEYFDELATRMSTGPLLALALAREDAVQAWRDMLGPKEVDKAKEEAPQSLRAQYSVEGVPINTLHGSDSQDTAQQELDYFFPMQQTVAVIKPDAIETKEEIINKIKEAGFHVAARKETTLTKDIAETFYKDQEGKEYYGDLVDHMTSGPTLFMVLSRESAVDGWRSLLGPTDPEQAKTENPDSLRAKFGTDIKANALHGSSTEEQAQNAIKLVFGDLEFNKDGTLKTNLESEETKEEETEQPSQQAEGEAKTEEKPQTEGEGEEVKEQAAEGGEAQATQEESQQQQEGEEKKEEEAGQTEGEEAKGEEKPAEGEEQAAAETTEEQKPPEESEEQKPAEATEEKPAEEQAPAAAESEQAEDKPAETEEKPAEAEPEKAAEETTEEKPAEEKPAEAAAEEKPAEAAAEEKPAETAEEKPAETAEGEEAKPAAEGDKPAEGEEEKKAEGEEAKT